MTSVRAYVRTCAHHVVHVSAPSNSRDVPKRDADGRVTAWSRLTECRATLATIGAQREHDAEPFVSAHRVPSNSRDYRCCSRCATTAPGLGSQSAEQLSRRGLLPGQGRFQLCLGSQSAEQLSRRGLLPGQGRFQLCLGSQSAEQLSRRPARLTKDKGEIANPSRLTECRTTLATELPGRGPIVSAHRVPSNSRDESTLLALIVGTEVSAHRVPSNSCDAQHQLGM